MTRELTKKRLSGNTEALVNPMDSIANMADVMLVLAVGIMLALIINWNVDLAVVAAMHEQPAVVDESFTFTEEDLEYSDEDITVAGDDLKRLGSVYYDETTEKYYIVKSD